MTNKLTVSPKPQFATMGKTLNLNLQHKPQLRNRTFQRKIFKLEKMLRARVSEPEGYIVYVMAANIIEAVASSTRLTSLSRLMELSSIAK